MKEIRQHTAMNIDGMCSAQPHTQIQLLFSYQLNSLVNQRKFINIHSIPVSIFKSMNEVAIHAVG